METSYPFSLGTPCRYYFKIKTLQLEYRRRGSAASTRQKCSPCLLENNLRNGQRRAHGDQRPPTGPTQHWISRFYSVILRHYVHLCSMGPRDSEAMRKHEQACSIAVSLRIYVISPDWKEKKNGDSVNVSPLYERHWRIPPGVPDTSIKQ